MVNCNPETVSTDYDTSDRLYFEPLTDEDVANVLDAELAAGGTRGRRHRVAGRPDAAQAGRLAARRSSCSAPARPRSTWPRTGSAGTRCATQLGIPQPPGGTATSTAEALAVAGRDRLPGAAAAELRPRRPGHGDRLRRRRRAPGHAVDDHRRAGPRGRRHGRAAGAGRPLLGGRDRGRRRRGARRRPARSSSPASWSTSRRRACTRATRPARCRRRRLSDDVLATLEGHTRSLAEALEVCGLINVQYAVKDGQVYVLEANPRASRTVPFVAKATGVPLAMVAARVMVGQTLADLRAEGLLPPGRRRSGPRARPRQREGGGAALRPLPRASTRCSAPRCARPARSWASTSPSGWPSPRARWRPAPGCPTRAPCSSRWPTGTSRPGSRWPARSARSASPSPPRWGRRATCAPQGVPVDTLVAKVGEEGVASDAVELIAQGKVQLVVNTPRGLGPRADGQHIRTAAVAYHVPCLTTLAAARAAAAGMADARSPPARGAPAPGPAPVPGARPR